MSVVGLLPLAIAAFAGTAVVLCLLLLLPIGRIRVRRSRWILASGLALAVGAAVGAAVGDAVGGAQPAARMLLEAVAGAGGALAILNLGPTFRLRRTIAAVAIPCLAITVAGVSLGPSPSGIPAALVLRTWAPRTVHAGPGYPHLARWDVPLITGATSEAPPASKLPEHGALGSVVIPATASHFRARPAIVYLPPAALTAHPVRLPVVIAFSGQSRGAGPDDVVTGGRIASIMDGIAHDHDGVAPVVVVPDQLGPASGNPMCVDSRLGNVATYITHDVRDWILTHLPVMTDRRDWTVAGFSEGGTCSIQFGAGRPDLFGSLVDVSGERAPANGSEAHTIAVGFHGSARAYAAASPFALLAAHHYGQQTDAFFVAGSRDDHYGPVAPVMAERAHRAGMRTHLHRLEGFGHNWLTGHAGLQWGLDGLVSWWPTERSDVAIEHRPSAHRSPPAAALGLVARVWSDRPPLSLLDAPPRLARPLRWTS